MGAYLFEDFAKYLLKIKSFKFFVDRSLEDPDLKTDDPEKDMNKWMADEEHEGQEFLSYSLPFVLAYKLGRETLLAYLDRYFDQALEWYEYWEYRHSGFGSGFQCFNIFNCYILALCSRYYASINETRKATFACFYFMCCLSYHGDPSEEYYREDEYPPDNYEEPYDLVDLYDAFEPYFHAIKKFIGPDWQAVHPSITWNIGRYYLAKNNYRKAREFFSLGASIDYDGRQSIDPFIAVGKNQYELGLTYLKGLGVKVNPKMALKYFKMAAESAGEPTIPIIQDMRNAHLLPVECDPIVDNLNGYGRMNIHNRYKDVYYKELNEDQTEKLKFYADYYLTHEGLLDFGSLDFLRDVYRYRLHDYGIISEVEERMDRLIESTPVEDRSSEMDDFYISRWKEKWKKTVEKPTTNSGAIPKDPKPGDTFFYGTFNNEPLEWKVLEVNDCGEIFVITTKIILKMCYDGIFDWLNTDFVENVFTDDEKRHIVANDYKDLRRNGPAYIYLPDRSQLEALEDLSQPAGETDLARSLCSDRSFYTIDGKYVKPGEGPCFYKATYQIRGIRPVMDLYINLAGEV